MIQVAWDFQNALKATLCMSEHLQANILSKQIKNLIMHTSCLNRELVHIKHWERLGHL